MRQMEMPSPTKTSETERGFEGKSVWDRILEGALKNLERDVPELMTQNRGKIEEKAKEIMQVNRKSWERLLADAPYENIDRVEEERSKILAEMTKKEFLH